MILLVYIHHRYVTKPKQLMKWYASNFESLGFKVYLHPYRLFYPRAIARLKKYYQYKQDSDFEKHSLPGYDVEIFNILSSPVITLIHPDLIREFYLPKNSIQGVYLKTPLIVNSLKKYYGEEVAFAQGDNCDQDVAHNENCCPLARHNPASIVIGKNSHRPPRLFEAGPEAHGHNRKYDNSDHSIPGLIGIA